MIYSKQKIAALAECKPTGVDGTDQLHNYLLKCVGRHFGLLANSTDREKWCFYEKLKSHEIVKITRSEFEKGVLDNIKTE